MTEAQRSIEEADLIAYADGRLSPERKSAVDAWLGTHPETAAEVFGWERQNESIAALYGAVASERVPARLDPHHIARSASRRRWPAIAAAAVVVLGLGLGAGWFGRDLLNPPESQSALLIDSAVTAHSLYVKENRHAVEVAATDRQHLVTWLSNRIRAPLDTPDLMAEGFNLVGGRLLPAGVYSKTGPAAQLMYENATAERLTVYVTGALPDKAPAYEFVNVAGLDAFYWANAQITCTVVGDLPEAEMQAVAKKVYQQLTRRPDTYIPGRG
jgi:anti-sigma factor RsiW